MSSHPTPHQDSPRSQQLRTQLQAFVPVDDEEATHRRRMLELLDTAGDPFDRDRFAPGHFTASAFVVSPDRRRVLLILHAKLGLWLQPGGHIEPGDESAAAAARRELAEETGLARIRSEGAGPFDLDVHQLPAYGGNPPHEHFDARYLFTADLESAVAGSDALETRVFDLAQLGGTHSDRSVLRAASKIIAGTIAFGSGD